MTRNDNSGHQIDGPTALTRTHPVQNRVAHFVHDFAGIDLPLSSVVCAIDIIATPSLIQEFVATAWMHEIRALDATEHQTLARTPPLVDVVFGEQRARSDAVILPVAWHGVSTPWIPPLDADVEFAAFGPQRTHVHLYGSSELPPDAPPASVSASLAQRLTVAVVRHVLTLLSQRIVSLAQDGATTSPQSI